MIMAANQIPKRARGRRRRMHADQAVALIRVSTEDQELGPEAQRATIEAYARAQGIAIVEWYEELGVSGGLPLEERKTLWDAICGAIDRRCGVFLVARRDRVSRDVFCGLLVERHLETGGVRLLSADGTGNGTSPEAELLRSILAAVAQYERALIRMRTKAALAAKARRGERTGQIAYGKRLASDGRSLEIDPAETAIVARIHQLRSEGETFQAITDHLNASGIPARGARWHITTVQRILRVPNPNG